MVRAVEPVYFFAFAAIVKFWEFTSHDGSTVNADWLSLIIETAHFAVPPYLILQLGAMFLPLSLLISFLSRSCSLMYYFIINVGFASLYSLLLIAVFGQLSIYTDSGIRFAFLWFSFSLFHVVLGLLVYGDPKGRSS